MRLVQLVYGDVLLEEGRGGQDDHRRVDRPADHHGEGFKERPKDWEANKRLADAIIAELNTYAEGLGKTTRVKTGRYNQHMAENCILIEIGHNQNTLEEVMNTVPYIAKAMNKVFTRDLDIQPYSVP